MFQSKGNLKEQEMVLALNEKSVKDLSINMKNLMRNLFGALDEEKCVKCIKVNENYKTDFVIEYGSEKRNVSMKSGRAVIMHNEILLNFISYLRSKKISEETLETICLFHYGDGTTDGSNPENRMGYEELSVALRERIKAANKELNNDMNFILDVMDHCVFKGSYEDGIEADCIYFGDVDYGVVASKKQFIKNTMKRGFDYYDHLHIGHLLLRPDARYLGKEIKSERKRNRIVCYWPNLREDIEYMARHYNF